MRSFVVMKNGIYLKDYAGGDPKYTHHIGEAAIYDIVDALENARFVNGSPWMLTVRQYSTAELNMELYRVACKRAGYPDFLPDNCVCGHNFGRAAPPPITQGSCPSCHKAYNE